MSEYHEEAEELAENDALELLIPAEQQILQFYGQSLIVMRLSDGRPAVVLRSFCENMQIDTNAQVKRVRRTEAIADDLVQVRVETSGGPQAMAALLLRAIPFWLAGIDPKRVREEIRPAILRYQREVVDMLYAWAQAQPTVALSRELVPTEPITQPTRPEQDAPLTAWHDYYSRMAAIIAWQMEVEQWRGSIESRLEGVEAMTALVPEILGRLGPETITLAHQRQVQAFVKQLSQVSGKAYATIYDELKTVFHQPRYQELPEAQWSEVENWFKGQIERAKKKPRTKS